MQIDEINKHIRENEGEDRNDITDGYHTFGQLYDHRIHLFIALCKVSTYLNIDVKSYNNYLKIRKSKLHFDGSEFEGWFIIQLDTPYGQISYHLPNKYRDTCDFIETVEKANERDGHTSDDVLKRLLQI